MKTLIIFFMLTSLAFAQPILVKPNISVDKLLTKQEQTQVRNALRAERNLISKQLTPAKNDYVDDYDRGTVLFNPAKGTNMLGREVLSASNYSFQKVIIPDGTVIKGVNFTQKNPDTPAIQGKNLTFINSNLVNVRIDPTWTIISSNTTQKKEVIVGNESITYNLNKQGKWIEVERETIIP